MFHKGRAFILILNVVLFASLTTVTFADTISILSNYSLAQFSNTNYGYVSFVTPGSILATNGANPVVITNAQMTGQAWGDHVGWIQLNGVSDQHVLVTCSGTTAILSGYAWGENTAWIEGHLFNLK